MSMPPQLWLDYQRPAPGQRLPGIALLALAVAVAVGLAWFGERTGSELDATAARVATLRQTAERQRLLLAASEAQAKEGESVRALSKSAARWEALFATLEKSADENVTLLGLAPGTQDVLIDGEALNLPAALDYAQRLQSTATLSNAHVARYEVVRDQPAQPVRFSVQASWQEGG